MSDWNKKGIEQDLEFYVKYSAEQFDLDIEYIIDVVFHEEIQNNWIPKVGDLICGPTGNIFVISGKHHLHEDLGGTKFFYGGSLCNRDGGCLLDSTMCYTMNESGLVYRASSDGYVGEEKSGHSSFHHYRWIPRPVDELSKLNLSKTIAPPDRFHGGFDLHVFRTYLETTFKKNPNIQYTLDLSEVEFMDTSAFRVVFDFLPKFKKVIPPTQPHIIEVYNVWLDSKKGLYK